MTEQTEAELRGEIAALRRRVEELEARPQTVIVHHQYHPPVCAPQYPAWPSQPYYSGPQWVWSANQGAVGIGVSAQ